MIKIMLDDGAKCPTRAYPTDAGLDMYSREDVVIRAMDNHTFDTGVHIAFEPNTYGKVESKSGLNVNHDIVSCGGVIDESYRGSIAVKLYNLSDTDYHVHKGDKIAQLVIMTYHAPEICVVDHLDETDRGSNGFGSSGR